VQSPVGKLVRPVEQRLGRARPVRVPVLPDAVQVAVDAAARDDDGLAVRLEFLIGAFEASAAARHPPASGQQRLDAVVELHLQPVAVRSREQVLVQHDLQLVTGPPHDVPPRHRVAGPVQPPLDPQRHRHELHAHAAEPVVDL
jgi:hypothetical protein